MTEPEITAFFNIVSNFKDIFNASIVIAGDNRYAIIYFVDLDEDEYEYVDMCVEEACELAQDTSELEIKKILTKSFDFEDLIKLDEFSIFCEFGDFLKFMVSRKLIDIEQAVFYRLNI